MDPSNEPPAPAAPKKLPIAGILIVVVIAGLIGLSAVAYVIALLVALVFGDSPASQGPAGPPPGPPHINVQINSAPGGRVTILDDASPPHKTTAPCVSTCVVHLTSTPGRHTFVVENGDGSSNRVAGRITLDTPSGQTVTSSVTFDSTVDSMVLPYLSAPPGQKDDAEGNLSAFAASGARIVGRGAFHDRSGRAITAHLTDVFPGGSVSLANPSTVLSNSASVRVGYNGAPHATAILTAATTGGAGIIDGSFSSLGNAKTFPYPGGDNVNVQVLGPDKALWAASKPDQLVRVAPDGTLTQINFHGNDEFAPNSMVLGPDGNFWLTYQVGASCDLVRVTPAGDATRISDARFTGLHGIASGPDGNIWVADRSGLIFRVTPAGVVTAHSGFSGVWQIAFGADGKLYYTSGSRIIGAFDTARGTHVQYQIPNLSGLGQLVRASDGNIWFSGNIHERAVLGWLAPSGESRVFALPASASPSGLAVGADGHVWFGDTKFGLRWITRDGHVGGYPLAWIDDGVSTISVAADGSFWIAVIGNNHADPAFIHVDF